MRSTSEIKEMISRIQNFMGDYDGWVLGDDSVEWNEV